MATSESNNNDRKIMEDVLDAALDELDEEFHSNNAQQNTASTTRAIYTNNGSNVAAAIPSSSTPSATPVAGEKPAKIASPTAATVTPKKSPPTKSTTSRNDTASQIPDVPSPEMMEDMMKLEQMMKQLFQISNIGGGSGGEENNTNKNDDDDEQSRRLLHEMQQFMAHFESQAAATGAPPPSPQPQSMPKTSSSNSKGKSPISKTVLPVSDPISESDVSKTISSLLEDMAKTASHDADEDADDDDHDADLPNVDEQQFLQGMMKELEGFASGLDADHVIDGMMEQLVSKDIMYEPLRQVTAKFPQWLADYKDALPAKEYQQRCQQYACFQKLVHVYETDPTNSKELMTLMQDVQEFGQPPAEIIHDIAPGLELDEHGVPKMDGMTGGLPFGGNEECRIM